MSRVNFADVSHTEQRQAGLAPEIAAPQASPVHAKPYLELGLAGHKRCEGVCKDVPATSFGVATISNTPRSNFRG